MMRGKAFLLALVAAGLLAPAAGRAEETAGKAVGVVSHIKVLSDKVPDVSSLEAWKKAFIKDNMTETEKALAVWKSVVTFRYQDPPPVEGLHEGCVHDAIKTFNVYGYGMCCCASSNIEQLSRYVGLEARGYGCPGHSLPEVKADGEWHMLDASLVNYFTKPDGKVASMDELVASVKGWLEKNPDLKKNDAKLRAMMQADGWTGWKKGPELLANCTFYNQGWWPAGTHGWYSTMQEYDGSGNTPFTYEYGYSQGYQVNVELRPGEKLTRNWFNKGLHVNGVAKDGDAPGCLAGKVGEGSMKYLTQYGDLNAGRIGSGTVEYDVPLSDGTFRSGALKAENVATTGEDKATPALHLKDAAQNGVVEIRMPCPYVYLGGEIAMNAVVGDGGKVRVFFSDNNGGDWKEVATFEKSGEQKIDMQKFVLRRYDYRLRFILAGKGSGIDALKITSVIQCSQRALPTLAKGDNTITFSAGPAESTITVEGTSYKPTGKNVSLADFSPTLKNVDAEYYHVNSPPGEVTIPIATPADMTRLRFGGHYRARDKADKWDAQVSFDDGKTFKTVDTYAGPCQGKCQYTTVSDIPAGTRAAQVRWVGDQRNTTCLFLVRIDADYKTPAGGFRPVKTTYTWEEGGVEKKDVHVAAKPEEAYTIKCEGKPEMKSLVLELDK